MNETDIFGKGGNGSLDAIISHEVEAYGKNWDTSKGDRWLDVSIDYIDLLGIHSETFRLIFGKEPEIEYFFIKNWESVESQISAEFPMLCRIKDMYEDAIFQSGEVNILLEECVKLRSASGDKRTDLALRKLIYCCNEAAKTGLHLGFWCD